MRWLGIRPPQPPLPAGAYQRATADAVIPNWAAMCVGPPSELTIDLAGSMAYMRFSQVVLSVSQVSYIGQREELSSGKSVGEATLNPKPEGVK